MGIDLRVAIDFFDSHDYYFFSYCIDGRQLTRNLGIPLFTGTENKVFIGHRRQNWSWLLSLSLAAYSSWLQLQTIKMLTLKKIYFVPGTMLYVLH